MFSLIATRLGGGWLGFNVDCHRAWECIFLCFGIIPIVLVSNAFSLVDTGSFMNSV